MTMGHTQRQGELLAFISGYIAEHGVAPSCDEMKDAMGLASKSGVNRMLNGLEERGLIRRVHFRARALEVVGQVAPRLSEADLDLMTQEQLERLWMGVTGALARRKALAA